MRAPDVGASLPGSRTPTKRCRLVKRAGISTTNSRPCVPGLARARSKTGFCIGWGVELRAPRCRYRVARHSGTDAFRASRVMSASLAGVGAASSAGRRVAAAAALDMLLTGRALDARRAKRAWVSLTRPLRPHQETPRQELARSATPPENACPSSSG